MNFLLSSSAVALLVATFASGDNADSIAKEVAEIRLAPTNVDRLNVLTDSEVRSRIQLVINIVITDYFSSYLISSILPVGLWKVQAATL